jgi:hypothetical protein
MALDEGTAGTAGSYPEKKGVWQREKDVRRSMQRAALGVAGVTAGLALLRVLIHREST